MATTGSSSTHTPPVKDKRKRKAAHTTDELGSASARTGPAYGLAGVPGTVAGGSVLGRVTRRSAAVAAGVAQPDSLRSTFEEDGPGDMDQVGRSQGREGRRAGATSSKEDPEYQPAKRAKRMPSSSGATKQSGGGTTGRTRQKSGGQKSSPTKELTHIDPFLPPLPPLRTHLPYPIGLTPFRYPCHHPALPPPPPGNPLDPVWKPYNPDHVSHLDPLPDSVRALSALGQGMARDARDQARGSAATAVAVAGAGAGGMAGVGMEGCTPIDPALQMGEGSSSLLSHPRSEAEPPVPFGSQADNGAGGLGEGESGFTPYFGYLQESQTQHLPQRPLDHADDLPPVPVPAPAPSHNSHPPPPIAQPHQEQPLSAAQPESQPGMLGAGVNVGDPSFDINKFLESASYESISALLAAGDAVGPGGEVQGDRG